MRTKRLWLHLPLTFALTWAVWFWMAANPANYAVAIYPTQLVAATMWVPGLCAGLTWLLLRTKEPFLIPLRFRFRGNGKRYLAAFFLPLALTAAGALLYFLIFPDRFNASGFAQAAAQYGAAFGDSIPDAARGAAGAAVLLLNLLLAPFLNTLFALGEEIGWRGLMMPALHERLPAPKAIVLGGVIWGLWHAPITALMGHNYGFGYPGYPYTGIAAMCVFCTAAGALLTYVTVKSRSVWPAALAHGAINAFATLPLVFLASGAPPETMLLGPAPSGLVAGIPALVCGILYTIRLNKTNGDNT